MAGAEGMFLVSVGGSPPRRPRPTLLASPPLQWQPEAIHGTMPKAEILGPATSVRHTRPSEVSMRVLDATSIGAHLRRV